jgi:hypothetical protein
VRLSDQDDPLRTWEYAERYLGVGTRTYSPFAADLDISPGCHPLLGHESFSVPSFWVTDEQGSYLRNGLSSTLHDLYQQPGAFLLPVHPDALEHEGLVGREALLGCKPGPYLEAVPSANARTVFVRRFDGEAVPPHFAKLHYPRRMSRFTRRLRRPTLGLHLWTAGELARVDAPVLPEVAAGIFGWDPHHSWGALLRELEPEDATGTTHTVPLLALYGRDHHAPSDPTLLEQLVASSGEPPDEFIVRRIVEPVVRLWAGVLLQTGCALEPHGQNTLFAWCGDGWRSTVVYRDGAIYVDPAIRSEAGRGDDLPPSNVISRDVDFPRDQVFSLTYDLFMGHHCFDYIARLAQARWGLPPAVLHEAARAALAQEPGAAGLLPETTFAYEQSLHADGRWVLVDTGRAPDWR